jgi:hypothetical protein
VVGLPCSLLVEGAIPYQKALIKASGGIDCAAEIFAYGETAMRNSILTEQN